ncbi:MAG: hypothetical protein AAGB34_08005, partial [Planctomycetota bacterium]
DRLDDPDRQFLLAVLAYQQFEHEQAHELIQEAISDGDRSESARVLLEAVRPASATSTAAR